MQCRKLNGGDEKQKRRRGGTAPDNSIYAMSVRLEKPYRIVVAFWEAGDWGKLTGGEHS